MSLSKSEGSSGEPIVVIEGLSKSYRRGFLGLGKLNALREINLEVRRGEVFGLLGPNGAGKTTLIKLLLGIIHPTKGRATVLQQPAGSRTARQRIGYLPENLVFPRHHTGEAALAFYGRLNGLSEKFISERSRELIKLVGLAGREKELVRKYSKGMRQRLGLAQAMLHEPEILILDEPTDGLDPLGRSQIRDLIETIRGQGKSVFLNSHILQEVELICDRVAIMARGNILAVGSIGELITKYSPVGELRVDLEVVGDDARCREIFTGEQVVMLESLPTDDSAATRRFHVQLNLATQSDCDTWIDRLRASGLSIVKLDPHRLKLEEIFLQLVANLEHDRAA